MSVERWTLFCVYRKPGAVTLNATVKGPSVRLHGEDVDVVRASIYETALEALSRLTLVGEYLMDSDNENERLLGAFICEAARTTES